MPTEEREEELLDRSMQGQLILRRHQVREQTMHSYIGEILFLETLPTKFQTEEVLFHHLVV